MLQFLTIILFVYHLIQTPIASYMDIQKKLVFFSVCLSICLSLAVSLFLYLLYVCLSMSLTLFVCMSVCLSFSLYPYMSVPQSLSLLCVYLSLSVCMPSPSFLQKDNVVEQHIDIKDFSANKIVPSLSERGNTSTREDIIYYPMLM